MPTIELYAEIDHLQACLTMALELLEKSCQVIDDMRLTDRYNSRVDFDVNKHLTDLENFLSLNHKYWEN